MKPLDFIYKCDSCGNYSFEQRGEYLLTQKPAGIQESSSACEPCYTTGAWHKAYGADLPEGGLAQLMKNYWENEDK